MAVCNTTGITNRAGTDQPFGAPKFTFCLQ